MGIRWHLKELIGRVESVTGERISYREISRATGISPTTITKIATGQSERVDIDTIDKLLDYLENRLGERLTIDDLLRRYDAQPDE